MERNALVDRLRGYACFLVLFGHVIMGIRNAGINIPEFFHDLEKFIWSFHVPLFLFLSGVVYKITGEWKGKHSKKSFIKYKLINLGIPYILFSVIYILINSFVGQTNTQSSVWDILTIWRTPIAQYWFLYALFFLFCIWTVFSGILKNWQITAFILLMGYFAPAFGVQFGSFEVVVYSALAFGLGTFVPFSKIINIPFLWKILVILVHITASFILIRFNLIEYLFIEEVMAVLGIYSSILFISLLQKYKIINCFLNFMNRYSFQTYLLHTIFTAGIRIVLQNSNITQWWLHILLGCVGGIAFSTFSAMVAKKTKVLNICFFPTKTYKDIKTANPK